MPRLQHLSLPQRHQAARGNGHARVFASPLARRLARDAGIDISRVAGTGPHGRVIAHDVDQAKGGGGLRALGAAPAGGVSAPGIAPMADDKIRAFYKPGCWRGHSARRHAQDHRAPSGRGKIDPIPHFYLTLSCNIDRLMSAREGHQRRRSQRALTANQPERFRLTISSSRRWR